ncbi:MAG TPA: hypothetical protein VFM90_07580 [Cyclobacteriaceae bacterium]|nr:hypothetical protein [Cyclobacteriaceae bacterium]
MKRTGVFLLVAIVTACGGSLSDEQRRQMREASEQQEIVKVTEVEIMEAAFAKGRSVMSRLRQDNPDTSRVSTEEAVAINWLAPGETYGLDIEQQLIEAYLNSLLTGTPLQDNIQKIGEDSLLYTNPVVITRADSSIEIKGTWNIWISKRDLVLAMGKK